VATDSQLTPSTAVDVTVLCCLFVCLRRPGGTAYVEGAWSELHQNVRCAHLAATVVQHAIGQPRTLNALQLAMAMAMQSQHQCWSLQLANRSKQITHYVDRHHTHNQQHPTLPLVHHNSQFVVTACNNYRCSSTVSSAITTSTVSYYIDSVR
jgi:hypothetical protein